jgi:antitoxin component YwqK of YwqJK toxin-antitoxin module
MHDLDACRNALDQLKRENEALQQEADAWRPTNASILDPEDGSTSEGTVLNGKKIGEWTVRYPDGALKSQGAYLFDERIGHWKYWDESGNVTMEGGWSKGKRQGVWLFFDQQDKRVTEVLYLNGVPQQPTYR